MRSYELRDFGPDGLVIAESDVPRPGRGEVLVRMYAASINYRDIMIVSGTYNPRMSLPAVPLSDGAGEVVDVGDGVTMWKSGDRVSPVLVQKWFDGGVSEASRRSAIGGGAEHPGVLREYATFNEAGLVRIPDYLTFHQAAAFPCAGVTAWNALHSAGKLKPGETVVTLGTGGVSVFAIQIAKLSGARVIATTGASEKEALLRELGADHVINYRSTENWERAVLDLTDKVGADHVIEVGGSGTLSRSVRAAKVGGHVAMIGALTAAGDFDPITAFMRSIRLNGIFVGSRKMHHEVLNAFAISKMRPVIDSVFDFTEVTAAMDKMKSRGHFGKVIVDMGDDR